MSVFVSIEDLVKRAVDQLHGGEAPQGDSSIVAVVPNVSTKAVRILHHGSAGHVTGVFGLLALPFAAVRSALGKRGVRDAGVADRAQYEPVLLVFRASRVDVHEGPQTRIGEAVESYGYDEASYGRTPNGLASETQLSFGGDIYVVDGWYERDLRSLLEPLGVDIQRIG